MHQALAQLRRLSSRCAEGDGAHRDVARRPVGTKVGLDDWLAANPDAGFAELEALAVDELPDVEPAADTFDDVEEEHGWVVLEEVRDLLVKYVWFPSDGLADAVTLWIVHTHLLDVFDFTPRLHIRSAMKRCGKSRLLEVIELLVPRPMPTLLATPAVLYRSIEAAAPDAADRRGRPPLRRRRGERRRRRHRRAQRRLPAERRRSAASSARAPT